MSVTISGDGTITGLAAGGLPNGVVQSADLAADAVNRSNASVEILGVLQNAQSGNYTLALSDIGKHIYCTNAGSQTITVPVNASVAFPIGTAITLINNGTTAVTVSVTGVTMWYAGAGTSGNRTLALKGLATLVKVDTDTWFIGGAGLT